MRKLVRAAMCAAGVMALAGQASADVPTFTFSNSAAAGNGTFSLVTPTFPTSSWAFVLTGSDGAGPTPDLAVATTVASAQVVDVFTVDYTSNDARGHTADPAGYILNGVTHQITFDGAFGGGPPFVGDFSSVISLAPGDVFGFYVNSTDNLGGAASIRVELRAEVVPEPATWALMIGGFGMAGATLRRRRAMAL